MFLEYLYTLVNPDVNKVPGQNNLRAEYAFVLGDKYGLNQLHDFGREKLIQGLNRDFTAWSGQSDAKKEQM